MLEKIIMNPKINLGKPTISGTRITVEHILDLFAQWHSTSDILREYPNLKEDDIHAIFTFSAKFINNEELTYA